MSERTVWFIVGLVLLLLLSQTAPKIAGAVTIFIVIKLALDLQKKGLLPEGNKSA